MYERHTVPVKRNQNDCVSSSEGHPSLQRRHLSRSQALVIVLMFQHEHVSLGFWLNEQHISPLYSSGKLPCADKWMENMGKNTRINPAASFFKSLFWSRVGCGMNPSASSFFNKSNLACPLCQSVLAWVKPDGCLHCKGAVGEGFSAASSPRGGKQIRCGERNVEKLCRGSTSGAEDGVCLWQDIQKNVLKRGPGQRLLACKVRGNETLGHDWRKRGG